MAARVAAIAHVRVVEHTGVEVEPLPESCTVKAVKGRRAEGTAWVVFMHYAVSVEVLRERDGRCLALVQSLASIHFQVMGEKA